VPIPGVSLTLKPLIRTLKIRAEGTVAITILANSRRVSAILTGVITAVIIPHLVTVLALIPPDASAITPHLNPLQVQHLLRASQSSLHRYRQLD